MSLISAKKSTCETDSTDFNLSTITHWPPISTRSAPSPQVRHPRLEHQSRSEHGTVMRLYALNLGLWTGFANGSIETATEQDQSTGGKQQCSGNSGKRVCWACGWATRVHARENPRSKNTSSTPRGAVSGRMFTWNEWRRFRRRYAACRRRMGGETGWNGRRDASYYHRKYWCPSAMG